MAEIVALIPAYNEETNIKEVIEKLKEVKIKSIVVDDGSEDNTYKIASKLTRTIKHRVNKGKGESLNTGIRFILENYPKTEYIVLIDGDLQYDPSESIRLVNLIKKTNSDVVMGFRNMALIPLRHKIGNLLWRSAFNFFFKTKLRDSNCGFMVLSARAAKELEIRGGYLVENSIISQAVIKGLKVNQIQVKINYRAKSGIFRGIKMVSMVFLYIVKEGIRYRIGK